MQMPLKFTIEERLLKVVADAFVACFYKINKHIITGHS